MKEVIIDSGIPYHQIKDYFDSVAKPVCSEQYSGDKWEVVMEKNKGIGYTNLPVPRTVLTFKGEDQAVDMAVHNYRMEFLQAGG